MNLSFLIKFVSFFSLKLKTERAIKHIGKTQYFSCQNLKIIFQTIYSKYEGITCENKLKLSLEIFAEI